MIIDQHTALYGVMGYPLGHSLSPAMHNAAFLARNLNAVYLAFETKDTPGCVRAMKAFGMKGMSVTLPHKSAVIPMLDKMDALAEKIGAVNTIVNEEGLLAGYNTDAKAALHALERKVELPGKTCLIIGAGGAARAIGFILKEHDACIAISNRSHERGKDLASRLGCPFVPLNKAEEIQADVLVQTTPVGMYPGHDESIISENGLRKGMVVMDIIYNPAETRMLKVARDKGCLTVSGLDMFILQGAEQFRLWTGLEAPIEDMSVAVNKTLESLSETSLQLAEKLEVGG
jgi:shikimate dehydrogenase